VGEGYDAYRRPIGDHEGGDGFFRPIKSAVASYLARHGSSVDTAWLQDDLEQAIRDAPRDPANAVIDEITDGRYPGPERWLVATNV
jgi:hypothetical protein